MSSPHMSFRLNNYQLAKALRILITLEPNQPIPSLSQAAKIIIIDWISKHSINAPLAVNQADINAIKLISTLNVNQIDPYTTIQNIMAQAKQQSPNLQPNSQAKQILQKSEQQIQRELREEKEFNDMRRESLAKLEQQKITNEQQTKKDEDLNEQIFLASQSAKRMKPSEFHDPNITDSEITTVTDFSPLKEWTDEN